MAKKSSKHVHHETNAKAILSLVILLVAFSILIIFVNYKDSIIESGMFQQFILLSGVGMGLLIGLLFLVNPHYKKKKRK